MSVFSPSMLSSIPSLSSSRSVASGIPSLSKSPTTVTVTTHDVSFSPQTNPGVLPIDLNWYPLSDAGVSEISNESLSYTNWKPSVYPEVKVFSGKGVLAVALVVDSKQSLHTVHSSGSTLSLGRDPDFLYSHPSS